MVNYKNSKMKNIIKLLSFTVIVLLLSSCLKSGLDDLPAFEDAEIEKVEFEYRFVNSDENVAIKKLNVETTIDADNKTITCEITKPTPDSNLSEAEVAKIALNNIVCYMKISNAATITPIGNAPVLGIPGNFAGTHTYEVEAANGLTKEWKLTTFFIE